MASKSVLVLNAGSSSLKFKLFQQAGAGLSAVVSGLVERIGDTSNSQLKTNILDGPNKGSASVKEPVSDHVQALDLAASYLSESYSSSLRDQVKAVGHRVVHGKHIAEPALITKDVQRVIEEAADLAPLHNPANLQGITAATKLFPDCPQAAVFDTAFHQSMPPHAYMYALPYKMYQEKGVRKYGFHGTSYRYITEKAAKMLGKPQDQVNIIACHIGAGASMCAIRNGKCVDTTMGLTPLEGLVMGIRSGDLDPAVVLYLQNSYGYSTSEMDKLLNKQSGLLGLCGQADLRSVLQQAEQGDERAQLALHVFVHRVRKYIGSYLVHLHGKVDAIVFSAGVGENSPPARKLFCADLEKFGITLDQSKNEQHIGKAGEIQADGASIKVLVIPTDEELSIAQQTLEIVGQS
jgi:acetate kinase